MTDDPYNGEPNGFPRPHDIDSAADFGTIAGRIAQELRARSTVIHARQVQTVKDLERVRRRLAELRARRLYGA